MKKAVQWEGKYEYVRKLREAGLGRCSWCEEVKELSSFRKDSKGRTKHGLYHSWCAKCRITNSKAYNKEYNASELGRKARERRRLSGALKRTYLRFRERHPNRRKESDCYIKTIIARGTSISRDDIPPELVELKRMHMKIRQELKKQKTQRK